MKAAVIGATGFVGRALVPALARRAEVVAISRRGSAPDVPGVRGLAADVTGSLRGALDGVEVAYYLVHSLGSRDFSGLDRRAAENVAAEAERAGVSQIVYLGGLGDDQPRLSAHLRSRLETAAVLASGSVPVTTLRAAVIVGRGSAAFETIVALVDRLPVMIAPRWLSTPTQPIALDDMIRYLDGVAGEPRALGESFDAGGPEVLTYGDMVKRIARIRGRRPLILEAPVLTPRLSSYWLHLVTPVRANVARPLIEGLRNPTVAHDDRIRRLLPFGLTGFCDAARRALEPVTAPGEWRVARNRARCLDRRTVDESPHGARGADGQVGGLHCHARRVRRLRQPGRQVRACTEERDVLVPARSAESVKALKQIERFPGGEQAPAVIVYERPSGLTDADRRRIQDTVGKLNADRRRLVGEAQPPVVSPNGRAAIVVQPVEPGEGQSDLFQDAVQSIRDRAGESGGGLQVKVTGAAGYSLDAIKVFANINGSLLLVAALIVLILLIAIYRSPIFWIIRSASHALNSSSVTNSAASFSIISAVAIGPPAGCSNW